MAANIETQYAVVSFVAEADAVSVVPMSWLQDKMCYWPPYLTDVRMKQAAKNRESPLPSWTLHEMRILCIAG